MEVRLRSRELVDMDPVGNDQKRVVIVTLIHKIIAQCHTIDRHYMPTGLTRLWPGSNMINESTIQDVSVPPESDAFSVLRLSTSWKLAGGDKGRRRVLQ